MCILSMVMDYGRQTWPMYPEVAPIVPPQWPNDVPSALPTADAWTKFADLMKKAKEFDKAAGQPDCEDPEKVKWLERITEWIAAQYSDDELRALADLSDEELDERTIPLVEDKLDTLYKALKYGWTDGEASQADENVWFGESDKGSISEHWVDENGNPAGGFSSGVGIEINWQDGPLNVDGVRLEPNGAFVEEVIWTAIDRIQWYQDSDFHCTENAVALGHLQAALGVLNERTRAREDRGVEGQHKI